MFRYILTSIERPLVRARKIDVKDDQAHSYRPATTQRRAQLPPWVGVLPLVQHPCRSPPDST